MAQVVSSQSSQANAKVVAPHFEPALATRPLAMVCADVATRLDGFLASSPDMESSYKTQLRTQTKMRVRESLDVINKALRKYSFDELAISFNGGKDCLVMLILLLASLHYHASEYPPKRIHTVYVHSLNSFHEVDDFVNECTELYSLDLIRLPTPMKTAFQTFLEAKPQIKAIMVGTRRTDPNGSDLSYFDPTDHGWPKFMRVHPVIDWHYAEVWHILRELEVPYCILYDLGYTSLGGTTDTYRNPALADSATSGSTESFKPAYTLLDDDKERLGRNS